MELFDKKTVYYEPMGVDFRLIRNKKKKFNGHIKNCIIIAEVRIKTVKIYVIKCINSRPNNVCSLFVAKSCYFIDFIEYGWYSYSYFKWSLD